MSLSDYLTATLVALRAMIAHHAAPREAPTALLVQAWTRLGRTAERFARLVARWRAGTLPRRRPAPPRARRPSAQQTPATQTPAPQTPATQTPAPGRIRLPGGYGWLIRLIQPTAQFRPHMERLLAEPELAALLRDAPQAGRLLRPLCRMLAVPLPPALRLPPRPRKPRPPAAPRPKPVRPPRRPAYPVGYRPGGPGRTRPAPRAKTG